MPIAPAGMTQGHLNDGTTTQANESALTVANLKYADIHGIKDVSNLSILGFEHGYHGKPVSTLSCSDARVNMQEAPGFDWPRAAFTKIKYPWLSSNTSTRPRKSEAIRKSKRQSFQGWIT
jgi:adenosylmethionine-8-amino-7-oxononanoate aminotransferase